MRPEVERGSRCSWRQTEAKASRHGDSEPLSSGGAGQPGVEACELDVASGAPHLERSGKLHRIVAAEGVALGENAGAADEGLGDLDDIVAGPLPIQLPAGPSHPGPAQRAFPAVPGERG